MALDPNRWTIKTQEAVTAAIARAKDDSHPEVTPDHLLVSLLGQAEGVVLPILTKVGRAPGPLRNETEKALAALPKAYGADAKFSRQTNRVFADADNVRAELGDDYLSTEHLLLALANRDAGGTTAARIDLTREQLLAALQTVRGSHRITSQNPEDSVPGPREVRTGPHRGRPSRPSRSGHRP